MHVISPEEAGRGCEGDCCIIGIKDRESAERIAAELLDAKVFDKVFTVDYESFCIGLPFRETSLADIHYFYQASNIEGKQIVLIGRGDEKVDKVRSVFMLMGITCDLSIDFNSDKGEIIDYFKNKTGENTLCIVLEGLEEFAENLIEEFELDGQMFISSEDGRRFNTIRDFDPTFGFDKHGSMYMLTNTEDICAEKRAIRICILGNSCTDSRLFTEKSWPEHLLDIFTLERIPVIIYDGAVTGHAVSQELLKLLRDGLPLQPDIVISYSGTNEWLDDQENFFVNRYQTRIFRDIVNNSHIRLLLASNISKNSKGVSMGTTLYEKRSNTSENLAGHWYEQESLMNKLCEGCGIKFFAFIQPHLLGKHPRSVADKELIEHIEMVESSRQSHVILEEIENIKCKDDGKYGFVKNAARIFDGLKKDVYIDYNHLLSEGNRMVADTVFNEIFPRVKELAEL